MSTRRFGLSSATVEKICGVLASHPQVENAVVYGSRAKGTYKNGSDIDLTLEGPELTFDELLTIMGELDDLLLPYTIDLSLLRNIDHPALREHIERAGQELYRREDSGVPIVAEHP